MGLVVTVTVDMKASVCGYEGQRVDLVVAVTVDTFSSSISRSCCLNYTLSWEMSRLS